MKKFIAIALAAICLVATSSYVTNYHVNESVLKKDVTVLPQPGGQRLIAFSDNETGLIGFLSNNSRLTVRVEPMYEDTYNNGYLLIGVKKGGKWGIYDLGLRFATLKDISEPLLECKYRRVEIIDNFTVVCDGRKWDVRDMYEMFEK